MTKAHTGLSVSVTSRDFARPLSPSPDAAGAPLRGQCRTVVEAAFRRDDAATREPGACGLYRPVWDERLGSAER